MLRSSSWLYQYASQSKFSYGPSSDHLPPRQILSYNNHEYNLRRNLVASYNSSCSTLNGVEEAHCVEKADLEYTLMTKKKQQQQQHSSTVVKFFHSQFTASYIDDHYFLWKLFCQFSFFLILSIPRRTFARHQSQLICL